MQDEDELGHEDDDALPDQPPEAAASAVSHRANAKKKKRNVEETLEGAEFWRAVLADPIGRRELWKLFQAGHIFETRFECGPNGFPQVEATWFRAGEQDFARRIYQMFERIDPAAIIAMHQDFDASFAKPVPRRVNDD
jgi:hypothetical protein